MTDACTTPLLHDVIGCDCGDGADLAGLDLAALERDLERSILVDDFAAFVRRFWSVASPHPLRWNTAIDGMTAALQAVAEDRIRRLLIEIGPGLAKSTLLGLYAAWRIARDGRHRAIHGSYAFEIAANNSRRARRIVESEPYRAIFGTALAADDNTVAHWGTAAGGRYVATGAGGALTGHRADEAVVDDAINAVDARSKAARESCWSWFTESLSTRVDGDGAIVVVGQRLAVDDLIGRLRGADVAWRALTLPVEFDPARACILTDDHGAEVWRDPRTADGELLAPDTLTPERLRGLRAQIGSAAFAGQYNQRPASDEGAIIKRAWWRFYRPDHVAPTTLRPAGCDGDAPLAELPGDFDRVVIACDLTFGSAKGDFAVVQAWGAKGGARYLLRQWRQRAGFEAQSEAIEAMARDFPGAKIIVEKAANGAAVIETLAKRLPGVCPEVPKGSKDQRLSSVAPQVESGACFLPLGAPWLADFVEELAGASKHDDAADACAYALLALSIDPTYETDRADVIAALFLTHMGRGAMTLEELDAALPDRFKPARVSDLPDAPDAATWGRPADAVPKLSLGERHRKWKAAKQASDEGWFEVARLLRTISGR